MRGLSQADSGRPTPTCWPQPSPQPPGAAELPPAQNVALRSQNIQLLPDRCLGLGSNRSAAERSPKQVNLSQLDTVSATKLHAAHSRSQEQRAAATSPSVLLALAVAQGQV